jgi:hypothetical protein
MIHCIYQCTHPPHTHIHAQSFSQPHTAFRDSPIRSLRFNFNFGRELAFVSERVKLMVPIHDSRGASDTVFGDNDYHSFPFNVAYTFSLKPHQHKAFIEYLYSHTLVIDVWDADSLFHVSTHYCVAVCVCVYVCACVYMWQCVCVFILSRT